MGDIVKMDLGCHIDGYIAVAAHTVIVPENKDTPVDLTKVGTEPENSEVANQAKGYASTLDAYNNGLDGLVYCSE